MPSDSAFVQSALRGVAVGLLTPFDAEGEIDHRKLRENAEELGDRDIQTFLATANISEYHALSREERIAVVEKSVEALPAEACVLAGTGGATDEAKNLIRAYDKIGVDAMMIMPPDHTYVHEQGLLGYYRKLGETAESPLVPYIRGFVPSVSFLVELTNLDPVAGIKYALPDPSILGAAIDAGQDDVVWINGLAEPYAVPFWAVGAEGFSAGVSNFRPIVGLSLFEALNFGEWGRARELAAMCVPFQQFRDEAGHASQIEGGVSVPAVKKALELAGLFGGRVREPLVELTAAEERRVESLYATLDERIEAVIS